MLNSIKLKDFRNFKNKHFEFSSKTTVIFGLNASGKTNILESLFLLSTGKSFHARLEEEMIGYDKDLSRIEGQINTDNEKNDLEVVLTRGEIEVGDNKYAKAPRKKLLVNGIPRRLIDFAGNFKIVLFGPWDLDLVTQSPSLRRKFLDTTISQIDREYRRASLSYDKGLRQRNRILWNLRENPSASSGRSQLLFWDSLLIKNGDYITLKRREFVDHANASPDFIDKDFSLEYDNSAISESRLEQYKEEEVAAATTLVGPHRDDVIFRVKERESGRVKVRNLATYGSRGEPRKSRNLATYGSRGEQRMGVLWLKLAELSYLAKTPLHQGYEGQSKPTLLLDDIFSELDHEHRDIVMDITKNQQTIITTADPHNIKGLKNVEEIELK